MCSVTPFLMKGYILYSVGVKNPQATRGTPDCVMWPTAPFVNYVCHIQI